MQCWLKPFNIENLNFVTQNGKETNWMGRSQIYRVFYFHMMYSTPAQFLWFLCSFVASFFASKSGIGTIRPGIYGSATALWHSWPDINNHSVSFQTTFSHSSIMFLFTELFLWNIKKESVCSESRPSCCVGCITRKKTNTPCRGFSNLCLKRRYQ